MTEQALVAPTVENLTAHASRVRLAVLDMIMAADYGFLGSCYSCVELTLCGLYCAGDFESSEQSIRNFVLSKGHAAPVLYSALKLSAARGRTDLDFRYSHLGSVYEGHPNHRLFPAIGLSSGSLGLGLAVAVGVASANMAAGNAEKVFVLVGDGELQEGICWEALQIAKRESLRNLVVLVDGNGKQSVGVVPKGVNLSHLFVAAGFECNEVDGHDLFQLLNVLKQPRDTNSAPLAVIAHTNRGQGFPDYPEEAPMSWRPDKKTYEIARQHLLTTSDYNDR